jgi:hypothetical protein
MSEGEQKAKLMIVDESGKITREGHIAISEAMANAMSVGVAPSNVVFCGERTLTPEEEATIRAWFMDAPEPHVEKWPRWVRRLVLLGLSLLCWAPIIAFGVWVCR